MLPNKNKSGIPIRHPWKGLMIKEHLTLLSLQDSNVEKKNRNRGR
jgi:hypothetical protein